jgi:hypothetical protein
MIQRYHSWAYIQRNVLHVYCSIIHVSQALETAQMPHDR